MTARQVPQANSEPHPLWPPERKQVRFSSRERDCRWAIRYRPSEPPSSRDENSTLVTKSKSGMSDKSDPAGILPRPPDENLVFATNCTPSEPTLPLQAAGQRADCRGRGFQFSSRIFLLGDGFPDPLLIAASFAYLDFSYRTIPLRANPLRLPPDRRCEIKAEFSSRNEKARDAGFVTGKKNRRSDSLDKNRSVVHAPIFFFHVLKSIIFAVVLQKFTGILPWNTLF